jgi:hypothetical protein
VGRFSSRGTQDEEVTYPLSNRDASHSSGTRVVLFSGMKRISRKNRSIRLLRWVFQRGNQLLTCQLDREDRQSSYTLSLVPHWAVTQAASETFDAGVIAFRRHAAIADALRGQGWTLAAYSVAR